VAKGYDDGKSSLQIAIDEYDQAVIDLTASIISSILFQFVSSKQRHPFRGRRHSTRKAKRRIFKLVIDRA
jgi:hypothetical protein